jgi:hypothetical protein
LKPGHDDDSALPQFFFKTGRLHFDDACLRVALICDDSALTAGEADRGNFELLQSHRQQRHRDALAASEQHVQFATWRISRDLSRQLEQLIGGVSHRTHYDHHLYAFVSSPLYLSRDLTNFFKVRD